RSRRGSSAASCTADSARSQHGKRDRPMCGIVGYIGAQDAAPILLEGLGRLEYRGYDSAGVAVVGRGGLKIRKSQGRVADLAAGIPARFKGAPGIGHTRWATHGEPTEENA